MTHAFECTKQTSQTHVCSQRKLVENCDFLVFAKQPYHSIFHFAARCSRNFSMLWQSDSTKYVISSYFDFVLFCFVCNLEIHCYVVVRCNVKGVKGGLVQQLLVKICWLKYNNCWLRLRIVRGSGA